MRSIFWDTKLIEPACVLWTVSKWRLLCRAGAVAKGPASKKAKRSTDPTAQAPGAPLHPAPESGAGPMYGRVIFTVDILNGKTVVLLQDICRSRGIPTSGRKSEIVQRILTAQQAPYPHGAAGP